MWINRVSNTKLSMYSECGYKYLLKYHERIDEVGRSEDPLQFGSFIHKILELGYEATTREELQEIAAKVKPKYKFDDKKYPPSMVQKCIDNFLRFNATLAPTVGVEIDEKIELVDDITLHIIVDRVIKSDQGEYLIVDYKTSKREKTKQELFFDDQLRGYAVGMAKLFNVPMSKITAAHYYPVTNNFVSVKFLPMHESAYIRTVKDKVWSIRKKKAKDFSPTKNRFCDWCGYKYYCPLFHDGPTVTSRLDEAKRLRDEKKLSEETAQADDKSQSQ